MGKVLRGLAYKLVYRIVNEIVGMIKVHAHYIEYIKVIIHIYCIKIIFDLSGQKTINQCMI